jgi:hypothetical protein
MLCHEKYNDRTFTVTPIRQYLTKSFDAMYFIEREKEELENHGEKEETGTAKVE